METKMDPVTQERLSIIIENVLCDLPMRPNIEKIEAIVSRIDESFDIEYNNITYIKELINMELASIGDVKTDLAIHEGKLRMYNRHLYRLTSKEGKNEEK